jgi:hypothetical protein
MSQISKQVIGRQRRLVDQLHSKTSSLFALPVINPWVPNILIFGRAADNLFGVVGFPFEPSGAPYLVKKQPIHPLLHPYHP